MKKETLSQLFDGELNAEEMNAALDSLLADKNLQGTWQAMCTARACLQDAPVEDHADLHSGLDLSSKIAMAIEAEPAIMAPNNIAPLAATAPVSVASEQRVLEGHQISSASGKGMVAYLAMAASVAAVMAISYFPSQVQQSNIASTNASENLSEAGRVNQAASTSSAEQVFQSMVVQHGEFSGAAALNGLVAYAKVVNGSTLSQ